MAIKVFICDSLAALVAQKTAITTIKPATIILYEHPGGLAEAGTLRRQDCKIDQANNLVVSPGRNEPIAGKFLLIVKD